MLFLLTAISNRCTDEPYLQQKLFQQQFHLKTSLFEPRLTPKNWTIMPVSVITPITGF